MTGQVSSNKQGFRFSCYWGWLYGQQWTLSV